jgi:hypothetical protein
MRSRTRLRRTALVSGAALLALVAVAMLAVPAGEEAPTVALSVPTTPPGPEPVGIELVGPTSSSRPPSAPLLLVIPELDVVASVTAVGLLDDGGMAVPDDIATVGWFAPKGRAIVPGAPGTAVIAGHRDSSTDGAGALRHLADLDVGAVIEIVHADGSVSGWRVDEVVRTRRDELPVATLFTRDGEPRIALVTCGGVFNPLARAYSHNVIVTALRLAVSGT